MPSIRFLKDHDGHQAGSTLSTSLARAVALCDLDVAEIIEAKLETENRPPRSVPTQAAPVSASLPDPVSQEKTAKPRGRPRKSSQ